MIPDAIIKKYNLKFYSNQFGQSFVNDCKMYLWPNAIKGAKVYVMDGDLQGNRLKPGQLMIWVTYFDHVPPVKCSITQILTGKSLLDCGRDIIRTINLSFVKKHQ